MSWLILSILPNIDLRVEVAAEQVAIVPPTDERVVALRGEHPNLDQFLARFTGSHGRVIHPAILLFDAQAPVSKRTGEAMVGIRNALAVSTVLQQTAVELLYPQGHRILFTDPFDFYPWNLDRDFDRMISITPASMAIHRVNDFAGQPLPGSPVHTLPRTSIDRILLGEILNHWNAAYGQPRMTPMDRALFRSLNMATAAMRMPAATAATIFDYGRQCGLWISAFEILAHFEHGRANLANVFALLNMKPFHMRRLNARLYRVRYGGRQLSVTLAQKLYDRLYRVRNDFLHGNPVTVKSLQIAQSGRFVGHFAPLLYRFALRNFLDLHFVSQVAPGDIQR
ncbi:MULTISPECIES: hypothetical protein [unclassified Sphingomonas]|uniref:hypothetical protein n=1 Tax=unclassified Sphingomonas TaxID=196159 RepID=UPI00285A78EC|nr:MULTISPECIES: hypothetical protein [unclassified Sphingomonas]MDR6116689.1 hypothetical protein [Sphingomonas sp. SORGH_AS_0789]MDR6149633.1 hypothetical protein [Sphingomonas sp. SORGH_AS_0742]